MWIWVPEHPQERKKNTISFFILTHFPSPSHFNRKCLQTVGIEFLSILKIFEVDATRFGDTPVSVLLGGFEPSVIHSKANSFVVQFFRFIHEEEREGIMSSLNLNRVLRPTLLKSMQRRWEGGPRATWDTITAHDGITCVVISPHRARRARGKGNSLWALYLCSDLLLVLFSSLPFLWDFKTLQKTASE